MIVADGNDILHMWALSGEHMPGDKIPAAFRGEDELGNPRTNGEAQRVVTLVQNWAKKEENKQEAERFRGDAEKRLQLSIHAKHDEKPLPEVAMAR